jgi:hypothetical protein
MKPKQMAIIPEQIERLILVIRGQKVMLDYDLARIYGVPTKALNQAVKRNADRFPEDFAFQLAREECEVLRSQIVTSKPRPGRAAAATSLMPLPNMGRSWLRMSS